MSFLNWLSNLGDKGSRTDVWVVMYVLTMTTSAIFFFGCGAGMITACSNLFVTSNTILLTTHVTGIMVDLGIRRWNEGKTNIDKLTEEVLKRLNK